MLALLVVAISVVAADEEVDTGNQECSVSANSGGTGLEGVPECPCLLVPEDFDGEVWEYRSASGYHAAAPDGPNVFNYTYNGDGLGLFIDGVEQDYGYLCGTHDWGTDPWCNNMTDPAQLNSWCSAQWCCEFSFSQPTAL